MYKAQKLYHFGQREARPTALFEASKLQALFRVRVHVHFVLMFLPSKVFEHRISEYRKNKRQNKTRFFRNKDLTFLQQMHLFRMLEHILVPQVLMSSSVVLKGFTSRVYLRQTALKMK